MQEKWKPERLPFFLHKEEAGSNSQDSAGAVSRGEVRPVDARIRADCKNIQWMFLKAEKESPPRYTKTGSLKDFLFLYKEAAEMDLGTVPGVHSSQSSFSIIFIVSSNSGYIKTSPSAPLFSKDLLILML